MNVWLMNLKDNRDEKPNLVKSKFTFCKEKGIVGIGWVGYDSNTSNDTAFLKANAAISAFKCDDLVWVHNTDTKEYYICQITGQAARSDDKEYNEFDIGTYCPCKYYFVGAEIELPEGITGKDLISRSTISSANENTSKKSISYFSILAQSTPQTNASDNSMSATFYGANQTKKEGRKFSKKTAKKLISIIISIIALAAIIVLLIFKIVIPEAKYQKAIRLCKNGNYEAAIEQIYVVIDYRDASDKINEIRNEYAISLYNSGEFEKAIDMALTVSCKPNEDIINNCVKSYIRKNIDSPRQTCDFLTKYKKSITIDINDISYYLGCVLYNRYDFKKSYLAFGNGDSALNVEMGKKARYICAAKDANNGDLSDAQSNFAFLAAEKYKDANELSIAITKEILIGTWVAALSDTHLAVLKITNDSANCLQFYTCAQNKLTGQILKGDTTRQFLVGVFYDGISMFDKGTNIAQSTNYLISGSDSNYQISFSEGYLKNMKFSNTDNRYRSFHIDIDYGFIDDSIIQTSRDKILADYQN